MESRKEEEERIAQQRRNTRSFSFLGFEIRPPWAKQEDDERPEKIVSPVADTQENDPAYLTSVAAGYYGQVLDVRGDFASTDRDLIVKYRNAAMQPECDDAIEDIVNEAIVSDVDHNPVSLNLDKVKDEHLTDETRELMIEEFEEVCNLIDISKYGHDIFRRWYIDGRIAFHKVIDLNNPRKGILEVRPMNPINIVQIKQYEDRRDEKTGIEFKEIVDHYFLYNETAFSNDATKASHVSESGMSNNAVKLTKDSVAYITSGVVDASRRMSLSYLHKALRAVNQLRYMEDAMVINRLARAPQRRLFYIDVGQMNERKAMEYVREIRDKYRNKILYDASTGEVRQDAKHMSMLEDFWLPRKDGSRGTEISQLPGDDSWENISSLEYFQKKLYKSMNVPYGRLEESSGFNLGRSVEISRDELKFQKFVHKLRKRFSELFKDILKTQLILKGVLTTEEWDKICQKVTIDFEKDSYFTELKEAEILRERVTTLTELEPFMGTYFSEEYVLKKVLRMKDQEIIEMRKQIYNEAMRRQVEMPIPGAEDNPEASGQKGGGGGGFDSPIGQPRSPEGGGPPEGGGGAPAGGPPEGGGGGAPGGGAPGTPEASGQETGQGGINAVPPPPVEADAEGEEGEEEPSLNTDVNFPDLAPGNTGVNQAQPRWLGDQGRGQNTRGPDQDRRRIVQRRPSGRGRERTVGGA